jgi:acid-sensing ion channel, other
LDYKPEFIFLPTHYTSHTYSNEKPIPWSATSSRDLFHMFFINWPGEKIVDVESRIGYHLIIHRTDELPSDSSTHFRQNFHHTNVMIFPQQTLMSDELKQMSPQRRNCYLDHEKNLELFKVYSKQNCEHQCQSFAFSDRCACVPFYLLSEFIPPYQEYRSLNISFTLSGTQNDKVCSYEDLKCIKKVTADFVEEVAKCNCLERCESARYEFVIRQHPQ